METLTTGIQKFTSHNIFNSEGAILVNIERLEIQRSRYYVQNKTCGILQ